MAKKSKEDSTNKVLWLAGGAAVTGLVVYLVQKNLKDQDELRQLRYEADQRKLAASSSGGGSEGE